MSDRKYRQRGYQDDPRDRERASKPPAEKRPQAPRGYGSREPRRMNMPGFRDVVRCARCGDVLSLPIAIGAQCPRCAADLHTCAQCASFDTSSRFECTQPVAERVSPKDTRNTCTFFEARVTVERETHSTAPTSARKAFDDLFK
jgi:hypothetical protein